MNAELVTALLYVAAACGFVTVLVLAVCVYAACVVSGRISEWEETHHV